MPGVEEARDRAVGRDSLAVGSERRHSSQLVAEAERKRATFPRGARLAARVEPAQPDRQRVHERDDVHAPVRHALVLDHEDRRAAGVRAGNHVERVHTDGSVCRLPTVTVSANRRLDQRTRAARAQRRESRDELLTAALRVFAQRGYRQAGVDEIAAAAGYSKGALYWHFAGKEELLGALLDERIDAPMREMVDLLESAPADRDMSLEASREFARRLGDERDAVLLEREYWTLAIRDPALRARYAERQTQLRGALARALEARARHLGTPVLPMPAEDVARIVMGVIGGLAVDALVEPGSVSPDLLGEALALIYAGLVARAAASSD